jgi:hypothetical protein
VYGGDRHHADGFTLMRPNGGPASRHEDRAAELRSWPNPLRDGEARLEHVETHAWGDTLVLVMIERQHARMGRPARPANVAPSADWPSDGLWLAFCKQGSAPAPPASAQRWSWK